MSTTLPKILIVDDDTRLRNLLVQYLGDHGYTAFGACDGVQMMKELDRRLISLIILDLNLPGEDGLALCKRLRDSGSRIPILMLTARGEEVDRILGLESGADDYLPKPFSPRELVARIKAVLRRSEPTPHPGEIISNTPYRFGDFVLDHASLKCVHDDRVIHLKVDELALLHLLAKHAGQAVTRDHISLRLRGQELTHDQRGIDMLISRLRRHLHEDPYEPRYLRTVRGIGYMLVVD